MYKKKPENNNKTQNTKKPKIKKWNHSPINSVRV